MYSSVHSEPAWHSQALITPSNMMRLKVYCTQRSQNTYNFPRAGPRG